MYTMTSEYPRFSTTNATVPCGAPLPPSFASEQAEISATMSRDATHVDTRRRRATLRAWRFDTGNVIGIGLSDQLG